MKKIVLLLLLTIGMTTFAQQRPFHKQQDKQLHFAAGSLVSAVVYGTVYGQYRSKKKALLWSNVAAIVAGVAKETFDNRSCGSGFDFKDLGATAAGGFATSLTIHITIGKNRKRKIHK